MVRAQKTVTGIVTGVKLTGLDSMGLGNKTTARTLALAGVALATLVMVSGCGKKPEPPAPASAHASLVGFAAAHSITAPRQITGTGTVSAWQEVPVGAETGGLTAVSLLVDEGQSVTQGQPLLKMDDVLLQAQAKQARASYDQANKAYVRAQTLYKQGYLSAAALDNAQASMLTTQAAKETAETQLALATVRAPVSGIVTSRKAVLGQIVAQGAELFRIVRDGRVELNMQIVENDIHSITPGMPATVTAEATGTVPGTVRIVTPQIDPQTRLAFARISVPWSSGLRPGMFASGIINAGEQAVVVIPQSAVVYAQNLPAVYVPDAAGKVHLRKISVGATTADKGIIVNNGLTAGEKVITTGSGFLNDGDYVKLSGAAQSATMTGGEK